VDSHILNAAFNRLHKRDLREKRSACYIQRRWKRMKGKDKDDAIGPSTFKSLSKAKTKHVHAPAYLGEACLWTPYDTWDTHEPAKHPYSACCETRAEFVCIPRSAVQSIIEKFSPWLGQRFEDFRLDVVQSIMKAQEGQEDDDKDKEENFRLSQCSENAKERKASPNGDVSKASSTPRLAEGSPSSSAYAGNPPGSINYEAYAAMNHSLGLTANLAAPTSLGSCSSRSARSFRAAAAAAVARVSTTVTPRNETPRMNTCIEGRLQNGSKTNQETLRSGTGLSEPLLKRSPGDSV
jgi:hypothetical protein